MSTAHRVAPVVRVAGEADHAAIARLTLAAYEADGQLRNGYSYAANLADVAGRAGDGDLLVATDGARVLGAVLYVRSGSRYAEVSQGDEAEFRMLAVDPAAQRRGVGRALVRACIERATAEGRSALAICKRDFSAPAEELYRGFGFVRTPALDWSPAPGINLVALRLDLPVAG